MLSEKAMLSCRGILVEVGIGGKKRGLVFPSRPVRLGYFYESKVLERIGFRLYLYWLMCSKGVDYSLDWWG